MIQTLFVLWYSLLKNTGHTETYGSNFENLDIILFPGVIAQRGIQIDMLYYTVFSHVNICCGYS